MEQYLDKLLKPSRIYSRQEVLQRNSPVPKQAGVYAWYFKKAPPRVPLDQCIIHNSLYLLYLGISPSKPSRQSKPSSQNLINV
jgi:hypothetical protein